ncbi:MAG: ExbD/TolR family protein [Candidatus Sumerlaeota bacterium]
MRSRLPEQEDDAGVPMSPLIDCVFLLLIFFLVTTMIKKWEKQIPVTLPDPTSALAQQADDQTYVLGLDEEGNIYRGRGGGREGELVYVPVSDLPTLLRELADTRDTSLPLRIDIDHATPTQAMIDTVDICKLQGFDNVGVKLRSNKGR